MYGVDEGIGPTNIYIIGMAVLMEIIINANKGCDQISWNNILFADICLIRVTTADKSNKYGVDY